jgi:hypothetical protein
VLHQFVASLPPTVSLTLAQVELRRYT